MCGRYFFDLASSELKDYYDQVIPNAASKQIRVGYNEIFPSNHVVTLAVNQFHLSMIACRLSFKRITSKNGPLI